MEVSNIYQDNVHNGPLTVLEYLSNVRVFMVNEKESPLSMLQENKGSGKDVSVATHTQYPHSQELYVHIHPHSLTE